MMRMARNPSSFGMNVAMRSQASVSPLSMSMASMGCLLSSFVGREMHKLTTQPAALAIEIGHASWTRDPRWTTHRTRRLIAPASRLAGHALEADLVFLLWGEGRTEVLLQGGRPPPPSQAGVLPFVS